MNLEGKTVLVTGGAGAIAMTLVEQLLELAHRVVVLDNLSSGYKDLLPDHPKLEFIEGSVASDEDLEKAFEHDVVAVFHLAAHFANKNSVDFARRDLEVNGKGTLMVLEWALKKKVNRVVYVSSSCVYGNMTTDIPEDDLFEPAYDTPYPATKFLGEQYCNFFHHHYGLSTVVLRIFNSYGPGEKPGKYRNVIPNFIKMAMEGKPLPITGDGNETRDFNFVENTAYGIILAAITPEADGETFNIGGGKETRIIDVANTINSVTGNTAGIEFKERRNWDTVLRRCANIGKAKRILGYDPKNDLREGVQKTYDWFVKHKVLENL